MIADVVPVIPESAPFSPEQRAWLNGFFAGVFARRPNPGSAPVPAAPAPLVPLTIYFGSQTGTAEGLARRAAKEAGKRGFAPTVVDLAQASLDRLVQDANVLLITSTYGDGEPPDNARAIHAALASASVTGGSTAPAWASVRYSVCAIGDRNYPGFCQCGREFDERLERLGARRAAPRAECDVEVEPAFQAWLGAALTALAPSTPPTPATAPAAPLAVAPEAPTISRTRPWLARLKRVHRLTAAASAKEVNQIEFDLSGSGLTYEPGDALGVFPKNCPDHVEAILASLGCDGEEGVPTTAGERSLRSALSDHYDLGKTPPELLAALAPETAPAGPQVLDALRTVKPGRLGAGAFVSHLRKLQPRLYSIASSLKAHPAEVHLTVGAVRYELAGIRRLGVCSTFLADRCATREGTSPVFVHANRAFRLPERGDVPVIMIGPGTGIAPFRAFLEERRASGATGKAWLFFGDQHAATDFLYADELAQFQREGVLTRLDTAFSRDQPEKIYVQHRMTERARELHAWLESGAHVYVCGDASRMAKDVHAALISAVQTAGGMTTTAATDYIQALQTQKRYARDVY
ncbi:MAG: flavodoxin domain-containing protein [Opitutaceae bacterium]